MNFNKNGQEYKTFLGGFVTTILNSLIFSYAVYKAYNMISHHYNDFGSQENVRDKLQLKEKSIFSEINTTFFYEIKRETDDEEIFLDEVDF
jgi:hypothetical protein